MILLECPERIRRLVLVSSEGLGREVALVLRLASLARVVEQFGQAFMQISTRTALKARGHIQSCADMLRDLHASLLLLVALGAAACTPIAVIHSAKSPNVAFYRYETFGFETGEEAPEHYEPSVRSVQARRVIREEASKVLQAKGYRLVVAGTPDLVLWTVAGRRERRLHRPRSAVASAAWLDEDEEEDFIEGAFVIDAFDGATKELVWHGSARTQIELNVLDEPRLRRDVDTVLRAFPPGRSASASLRPQ